ncbi:MAG: efflux transporter outer membrane subunit [Muribaculaceae bacterium]
MVRYFFTTLALLLPVLSAMGKSPMALERPLPDSWTYTSDATQPLPSEDRWWLMFDDPVLDSLICMGEQANFDLDMAAKRMDAAARQMTVAKSAYYPNIGIDAGYTRSHAQQVNSNRWSAGASMSWEIDIFGKITSAVKQSRAQYRASRAEWVGAMVSMAGEIASTYVQLRVWEAELAVAQEHAVAQDSISNIVLNRYECGLGAKPQVDQSMAILHSTRATIPALRTSIVTAKSSLALLVARYPEEINALLDSHSDLPDYRQIVATGMPGELLRRRPDIIAAEQNLAAAAAAVGIAKKDFLPTLSINGSIGFAGPKLNDTFNKSGFSYSIAPTLSWTIFDGMARNAKVAAARDEMEVQMANYNYTVMNAYNEVNNAVNSYINNVKTINEYDQAVDNAREFLNLELDLYRQGLAPYSDVATAEQNFLNYANSAVVARGNALSSLITLYKALGGGFSEYK